MVKPGRIGAMRETLGNYEDLLTSFMLKFKEKYMSVFDRVIDKRKDPPAPDPCRVCGAPIAHTKVYNAPTMDCIKFLRSQIPKVEEKTS